MKNYLLALSTTLSAIFAPAKGMLVTALVLILIDLVTGIAAARKRKESINSAGIGRTVVKLMVYEISIALAFLTQTYLTGPNIPCASIVASLVGTTELLSCLENINEISGGQLLKQILDKISQLGKQ